MTSLQRLGAEIAGGVILCVAFISWWALHNHSEQKIGAAACIQATTETKATAVVADSTIEAAHAAQISKVVAVYEQKLSDSAHANDGLALRLRNYALRTSPVPAVRDVACRAVAAGTLPGGDRGVEPAADPFGVDAATQAVIEACAADSAALTALQAAWASQRVATTP